MSGFDRDAFIAELRSAATADDAPARIKALVAEAVADPAAVHTAMEDLVDDDVILFEDDTVSIWRCRFPVGTSVPPHDHRMRATIGLYAGAERNSFFERDDHGAAVLAESVVLTPGEVLQIDGDVIHAVTTEGSEPCCGIHVYLGKLTTVERSLFDPENGEAMAYSDANYERLTQA
ncbi:MAG: hypothetical protein AAF567_02620 [Actinomycetota bacterium]